VAAVQQALAGPFPTIDRLDRPGLEQILSLSQLLEDLV
jgi:hypothetical protein